MEVDSAALTVHAKIYTKAADELDNLGDFTLRDKFHINMLRIFEKAQFKPSKILDIGCSTGLSTVKFHSSFPEAEIIGMDLSPYMLSVAKHQLYTISKLADARSCITYLHASGEQSTLGKGDVDLVSLSLISHELPEIASKEIFQHAYDLLPSGGALAIMDMNPLSPFFRKFASNPFAFAAFKSTEPWIQEYVSMDMHATLKNCGFSTVEELENSPRHRTVVAFKM
jgi:ubiquinone/menaquinone biosynthesis C-methylase UbiE